MGTALADLVRNLRSGVRLALFLPVRRADFRIGAAALLVIALASAAIDCGVDWLRYGPDATLDWAALGSEAAALALLVLVGSVLAALQRDDSIALAFPIVTLASLPAVQLAHVVLDRLPDDAPEFWFDLAFVAVVAWLLAVLARAAYVTMAEAGTWRRRAVLAVLAAALVTAPLVLPVSVLPSAAWWSAAGADDASLDPTNPAAEAVLALQRQLQDEALAALADHVEDETDLYFVAFAPDGNGGAWRDRVDTAMSVMTGPWGADGRAVAYLNDYASLAQVPIASVTHLREALDEIGAAANPDEDVVVVYLAGRSQADGALVASLPPLELVPLTGRRLTSLFEQSGIRWRVVIVAACDPEPFIDALADANTLVMAAAGPGETARGCADGGEPTAFADALFDEGMPAAPSLQAAFNTARLRSEVPGATPYLHVGEAIAPVLGRLRGARGGRTARLPAPAPARLDGLRPGPRATPVRTAAG